MFIRKQINSISLCLKIIAISLSLLTNMVLAEVSISYDDAKNILELNCNDCYGETKQGLEKGIAAMESIIDSGVDIPLEGGLVLAESYHSLAFKYEYGTEERKLFSNKSKELFKSLGIKTLKEIDSSVTIDDKKIIVYTNILDRYAASSDSAQHVGILEKTLSLNPENSRVRFTYGQVLLEAGKIEEGQMLMERAFSQSQYGDAINQATILINAFNEKGQYAEAKRIFTILEGKNLDQDITSLKKNLITEYKQIMGIDLPDSDKAKPQPPAVVTKPQTATVKSVPVQPTKPTTSKVEPASEKVDNRLWYLALGVLVLLVVIGVLVRKRR